MAENSFVSRFGFDPRALRSVEMADPRKVLSWSGDWKIQLDSGRELSVGRIYQYGIYAGLHAGIPSNIEPYLVTALKNAREFARDWPVVMLEPVLRALRAEDSSMLKFLPRICTITELNSYEPARDKAAMFSTLIVVWFSDNLGWPDDEDVLRKLRAIDWEAKAEDGNF